MNQLQRLEYLGHSFHVDSGRSFVEQPFKILTRTRAISVLEPQLAAFEVVHVKLADGTG